MGKNRRIEKSRARLCIVYIFIYLYLHPSLSICLCMYFLQWMYENIYTEVFPTFLSKKSYDWWITRRRMEIYTKISKRKYLKWSRQKQRKIRTTHGLCECCVSVVRVSHKLKVLCECCVSFAQAEGVVRISHKPRAVVLRRPYLPHFSSKLYTV